MRDNLTLPSVSFSLAMKFLAALTLICSVLAKDTYHCPDGWVLEEDRSGCTEITSGTMYPVNPPSTISVRRNVLSFNQFNNNSLHEINLDIKNRYIRENSNLSFMNEISNKLNHYHVSM